MKEHEIMARLLATAGTSVHYDIYPSVLVEFEYHDAGVVKWATAWLHALSMHQRYGWWCAAGSEFDPLVEGPNPTKGAHRIYVNVILRSIRFVDNVDLLGSYVCDECGKHFDDDDLDGEALPDRVLCGTNYGVAPFCATKEPF